QLKIVREPVFDVFVPRGLITQLLFTLRADSLLELEVPWCDRIGVCGESRTLGVCYAGRVNRLRPHERGSAEPDKNDRGASVQSLGNISIILAAGGGVSPPA